MMILFFETRFHITVLTLNSYVAEVGLECLILLLPAEILGVLTTFSVIFNIKELDIL